ncbi:tetratricopeptide repeat protein [Devosia sp.]|uniref:tetratricopeptide repeat protein n=1 Tax=Devosia sp. TaxID=1871048 RepID=UPI0035B1F248
MTNDNFIREIDDELRSDRMRALWRQFGPYVIGAAVGVVLLVAVNEGWTWWQNSNAARSSDQFYSALEIVDGTDIAAAQAALEKVAAEGSGGYPTLARFRQAALLLKDGKTAEAVAAYDALAAKETNVHLRDLALVMAGLVLVDGGDVAQVEQRVGGLDTADNPLRNAAREALGLAKYAVGDIDGARVAFEAIIADPLVSQDTRSKLQLYLQQLVAEGAVDPKADASAFVEEAPSVGDAPALDTAEPAPAEPTPAEAAPSN